MIAAPRWLCALRAVLPRQRCRPLPPAEAASASRHLALQDQFKAVGDQVNATKLEAMKALMRHFQVGAGGCCLCARQRERGAGAAGSGPPCKPWPEAATLVREESF